MLNTCSQDAQHHVNDCLDLVASPPHGRTVPSNNSISIPTSTPSISDELPMLKDSYDSYSASSKATSARGNSREVPSYKLLQGMPIAVDAFRYGSIPGVTAYFLTCVVFTSKPTQAELTCRHAHSDHYTNLASDWNSGPIYCSSECVLG